MFLPTLLAFFSLNHVLWETDGPIRTSKNLASREFGFSLESAGPAVVYPDEPRVFFNSNKTSSCWRSVSAGLLPITVGYLQLLRSQVLNSSRLAVFSMTHLEKILNFIHTQQFKILYAVQSSLPSSGIRVVATDDLGHTLEFTQLRGDGPDLHPLWYFGPSSSPCVLTEG